MLVFSNAVCVYCAQTTSLHFTQSTSSTCQNYTCLSWPFVMSQREYISVSDWSFYPCLGCLLRPLRQPCGCLLGNFPNIRKTQQRTGFSLERCKLTAENAVAWRAFWTVNLKNLNQINGVQKRTKDLCVGKLLSLMKLVQFQPFLIFIYFFHP